MSGRDRAGVLVVAEQLRRSVPGGIGVAGLGLLRGLAVLDGTAPDVTLYASRARTRPDPLVGIGYPVRSSRLPGPLLTRAWDVGALSAPPGFGVVHTLSTAAPPTRGAALVVTVHDVEWRHFPAAYPAHGRRWHEAALERALGRATRLVVPSETVGDDVVAAGAVRSSVTVVPLGSDHLPAPDEAAAATLLERLGVAGPFLLSVGTLEPRKNLERLMSAYRAARSSLPGRWPLVVVGPRGWGRHLRAPDGVVAAGTVEAATLAGLYRRARLLAYVPLGEGFGLPPVEAMRHGLPVVASPVPSTGGAAFEVDPQDVDALADALVQVAGDEEVRARLVAAGSVRAAALTWRSTAAAVASLWESLC